MLSKNKGGTRHNKMNILLILPAGGLFLLINSWFFLGGALNTFETTVAANSLYQNAHSEPQTAVRSDLLPLNQQGQSKGHDLTWPFLMLPTLNTVSMVLKTKPHFWLMVFCPDTFYKNKIVSKKKKINNKTTSGRMVMIRQQSMVSRRVLNQRKGNCSKNSMTTKTYLVRSTAAVDNA